MTERPPTLARHEPQFSAGLSFFGGASSTHQIEGSTLADGAVASIAVRGKTLAMFGLLGCWNDFMWPLTVLMGGELHTLPIALASRSCKHVQDSELMMAGAVVTVLPVLVLFLALQGYYMQDLLMGSVK